MRLDGAVSASGVEAGEVPAFVPIVAVEVSEMAERPKAAPIEIELAGAIVRIRPETDVGLLATVLRAVRSSSRRS